jgi:hypothetical protein
MQDRQPSREAANGLLLIVAYTTIFFNSQAVNAASAVAMPLSAPPGSFLAYPAGSPKWLANEIAGNAKVQQRYSKVYHVPISQMNAYFVRKLHIAALTNKYSHSEFAVHQNGTIYSLHKTLRPGERVYELANGQPVLQASCGNPLSASLPGFAGFRATLEAEAAALRNGKHKRRSAAGQTANNGHSGRFNAGNNLYETQNITPIERTLSFTQTYNPLNSTPSFFTEAATQAAKSGSNAGEYFAGLALAGGLAAGLSHGGGGSNGGPAVAPEMNPESIWVIGTFLLAGLAEVARRRRLAEQKTKIKVQPDPEP